LFDLNLSEGGLNLSLWHQAIAHHQAEPVAIKQLLVAVDIVRNFCLDSLREKVSSPLAQDLG
jgi:hypothetical protein